MAVELASTHPGQSLKELLAGIPHMMGEVPRVGRNLLRSSFRTLHAQAVGTNSAYLLGHVTLHWRVFVAKNAQNKIVFFFRKHVPGKVYMDIDLDLCVSPTDKPPSVILDTSRVRYLWFPPAFVFVRELGPVLKRLGMTEDQVEREYTIILSLREDDSYIMAARLRHEDEFMFVFEEHGIKENIRREDLRLSQLLALYHAIRSWIRGDLGSRLPVEISQVSKNKTKEVLNTLFQLFLATNNRLVFEQAEQDQATPDSATGNDQVNGVESVQEQSMYDKILPYYTLRQFGVKVLLGLNEEGDFATDRKDKAFQMRVDMESVWTDPDPELHLHVAPPDFLVSGDLFDLILAALDVHKGEITTKLGISNKVWAKAIKNAPNYGAIFRVETHEKVDTDLIVLPLTEKVDGTVLIFSGEFEVGKGENRLVKAREGSFKNRIEGGKPDDMVLDYFVRLLMYMRNWWEIIR